MWFLFSNKKKDKSPIIYSVEICETCGQINRRNFEPNDYVYKRSTNCKKCSGVVMITSIYGEYPSEKQDKKHRSLNITGSNIENDNLDM